MLEVQQTIENVTAVARGETTVGCLKLTDYHLIFTAPPHKSGSAADDDTARPREIWLAYPMLSGGELRPTVPASGNQPAMRLRGRDFYFITLHFPDNKTAQDAFSFVKARTCRLGSIEKLYAFHYRTHPKERHVRGWELYNIRDEFRRQGISDKLPDRGWRITDINKDYNFCPTYPSVLVVPTKIKDPTLKHAAKHRTRCRVPTLSYLHPVNNCSITRSSQPRVGLTGNRNAQDEALVAACFSNPYFHEPTELLNTEPAAAPEHASIPADKFDAQNLDVEQTDPVLLNAADASFDENGKRLVFGAQQHNLIIDARPAINSMAMQVVGKGSENMEYYKFASKAYLNIQNIHVMRNSLDKVVSALKHGDISDGQPNQDLLSKSDWLKHIRGVLDGSALIARQVGIQHSHVLIHCSDGWDRTSQLSALSQLMLDPYYRTLKGFMVLVEKDWLSFGHMFHQRSGFLNHEKWFVTQNDVMAGVRMEPGEGEGPAEMLDKTFEGAKRLFRQALSSEKDKEEADVDALLEQESSVVEDQATRPKEISPVFHQFLDAVYQLVRQYPSRFEFNERFLRRLFYHMYSCQYGTFLLNNEKQRKDAKLDEKTTSVWDYFLSRQETFINPDYDATVNDHVRGQERLIFPRLDDIRWWHQLFGRTDKEMNSSLDEEAARRDKVAETVESINASPRPGNSPPDSGAVTPSAGHQQPASGLMTFGNTVLAGVEVPSAKRRMKDTESPDRRLNALTKGLSGIGLALAGMGDKDRHVDSTSDAAREQEMSSMEVTGNVAP
ncbi:unnamed protein product [Discula destructiva]